MVKILIRSINHKLPIWFLLQYFLVVGISYTQTINQKPNVVFILADDLGYGDISILGQQKFATPNIDALASKGILFKNHYAGSTVCAPSRAVLLTGYHTGQVSIRGNKELKDGQLPLASNYFTIAELFKQNNYATGAFGKWGLGAVGTEGSPLNQGFDEFYGYNDQKLAHHYYPNYLWHNNTKITIKENEGLQKNVYAPELIQKNALAFIETHKNEPFFLFYPTILPHAELFVPENQLTPFLNKFEDDEPFIGVDGGEKYKKGNYGSQKYPKAAFAAMVTLLDTYVGELVAQLKKHDLLENTIIVFTSDNGPHQEGGANPDFFNSNSIYRGFKRDLYEGGIKVPLIISWQKHHQTSYVSDHLSAFWDFLPTFADVLDDKKIPQTNGISLKPTIYKQKNQQKHSYLYWEFHEKGGRIALRVGNYKLVQYNVKNNEAFELYDVDKDPSEKTNLAQKMPKKVQKLAAMINKVRTPSNNFNF